MKYGQDKFGLPGDDMSCPTCRQNFTVPADGLDKLPSNFFAEQIAEKKQKTKKRTLDEILCDLCSDDEVESAELDSYWILCTVRSESVQVMLDSSQEA